MNCEIVYVCNSINNKNIRANELNVLRKDEEKLCFEFGESESNIKIRFYRDLKTLNADYGKIEEIKRNLENEEVKVENEEDMEIKAEEAIDKLIKEIAIENESKAAETGSFKKTKHKGGRKKIF